MKSKSKSKRPMFRGLRCFKKIIRRSAKVAAPSSADGAWEIGKLYIIRTVTYFQVGRLTAVYPLELVIEDACWVADTERWNETLLTGKVREAEPFPDGKVIVGRTAVVDAAEWKHPPIRTQV